MCALTKQSVLTFRVSQDDDKRRGGITLARYQELYALYLGNPDEKNAGVYLFGPLNAGD